MRAHLTDVTVRALKPAAKQTKIWDKTTPGFGIRINGNSKSWIVMYGRRRSLKVLGRYPETPLADARKVAKKILAEQSERAPTPTFGDALERYYAVHFPTLRASTAYARKGVLERHYRKWERKELADITPQHVVLTLDGLLHTPVERYNAFKELKFFLRWCVGRQYLETNPCERLQPPKRGASRDRVLTDDELSKVWHASCKLRAPFSNLAKLLILTGQRRGETAKMRWEWIDTQTRTITIPKEVAKNGRQHCFPYGNMVAGVLDTIPRLNSTTLLFPARARKDTAFNGFAACKAKLDKHAGVDFDLHDLRRSFATKLAEIGVAPHVIERLLNHIRGQISPIAATYNRHSYLPEMKAAILKWEEQLTRILASQVDSTDRTRL